MYYYISKKDEDLLHYGVLGMKWGVRRYQNADGTLTAEGRKKYGYSDIKKALKTDNALGKISLTSNKNRSAEYRTQKQLLKQDERYQSLAKTDIRDLKTVSENNKKIAAEIREARTAEAAGALLKDLGYEDTKKGRNMVMKVLNSEEMKSMTNVNKIVRTVETAAMVAAATLAISQTPIGQKTIGLAKNAIKKYPKDPIASIKYFLEGEQGTVHLYNFNAPKGPTPHQGSLNTNNMISFAESVINTENVKNFYTNINNLKNKFNITF